MKKLIVLLLIVLTIGLVSAQNAALQPFGAWSSFMGNTVSCSRALDYDYSPAWIYGVTGFAFLLNLEPTLCPSGPTAFDNGFLKHNAVYLGLEFDTRAFSKPDSAASDELKSAFRQEQINAFQTVQSAMDSGTPVFGWELGIPEYYLIVGTDSSAYKYCDFDGSIKHCPYDRIGTSDIGMAEFNLLSRTESAPSALYQVSSALSFLDSYQTNAAAYALPGYTMGTAAYDVWLNAMQSNKADQFGLAYNAAVWTEARIYASIFLKEIESKLGTGYDYSSLRKAQKQYQKVAQALREICGLYGFPPRQQDFTDKNRNKTISLLKTAKKAEMKGNSYLKLFGKELGI